MKERYLLIDDLRSWSDVWVDAKPDLTKEDPHFKYYVSEEDIELVIARTFEEGIDKLINHGPFDKLYLDNDLNDTDYKKEGYYIALFLEKNIDLAPNEIICVSSNVPAKQRINMVIENIKKRKV